MLRVWLSASCLIAVGLILGCQPPASPVAKSSPTAPTSPTSTAITFTGYIPPSFAGEFNPNKLTIGTEVGQLAPEIEGKDIDGKSFKLSDYRGRVVLLDFWGDW
jgi:cytochrome oxidase Cu insertion factor (SCO1/SenC/PrrC family)